MTIETGESHVAVSVEDTGIGIHADQLAHVFGMFAQIGGSLAKPQGGLGTGLKGSEVVVL